MLINLILFYIFLSTSSLNSVAVTAPVAVQWIRTRRQTIRPWTTFLNTNNFQVPQSPALATQRIVKNIEYFQSNYFFVFVGLAVFCLVTSPFLLVALAAFLGACYLVKLKNDEGPLRICEYELNLAQQYTIVAICSIPVFLLAGASSAIFWLIGASVVFIVLHASFFAVETIHEDKFNLSNTQTI